MADADGHPVEYTAHVRPFLTHDQSRRFYDDQAEFEITEITLQTSVGTYLDSPYHRHRNRRDISQLALHEVILPGVVIDARGLAAGDAVDLTEALATFELAGKAVLVNFGWDAYWGTDDYRRYPFLARNTLDALIAAGAKLVGVDTLNIDDARNKTRPAHTDLLARDILIVENLRALDKLHDLPFTFFAVPLCVKGAAAMPVRAFAQVTSR